MSEFVCKKCNNPITDWRFGSPENGWEHLGKCPVPMPQLKDIIDFADWFVERLMTDGPFEYIIDCPTCKGTIVDVPRPPLGDDTCIDCDKGKVTVRVKAKIKR